MRPLPIVSMDLNPVMQEHHLYLLELKKSLSPLGLFAQLNTAFRPLEVVS